jgi:peptidoglycan/xylan/chitin deacetylase (PgdA/CDA1 family)
LAESKAETSGCITSTSGAGVDSGVDDRARPYLSAWIRARGARYLGRRAHVLVRRYGFTSAATRRKVLGCVEMLAAHGAAPTFMVPGRVVRRAAPFFRELQDRGVELAVHGYDHVDFRNLSAEEIGEQFARAARAFTDAAIRFDGLRCPYLSWTPALEGAMPVGLFRYTSNKAITWPLSTAPSEAPTAMLGTLTAFYGGAASSDVVSTPRLEGRYVELPVCLPDDLMLIDGLRTKPAELHEAWQSVLRAVHSRGELFVLLFHPESLDESSSALDGILREANRLQPSVWVARLRDISDWWHEKSRFSVRARALTEGLRLEFDCTERATILVRNVDSPQGTRPWHGVDRALEGRSLTMADRRLPFVGVRHDDRRVTQFLVDQGYLVESGERAGACSLVLDRDTLRRLPSEVALIDYIDSQNAPLVRYWRWPSGARSALSLSGDLDALALTDYLARLALL